MLPDPAGKKKHHLNATFKAYWTQSYKIASTQGEKERTPRKTSAENRRVLHVLSKNIKIYTIWLFNVAMENHHSW